MRDIDLRIILNKFLRDKYVLHDPRCILLDEFGLCQGVARIDVAVINGSIHGYEIKSEQDTLQRVKSQLEVYTKTLDYLTFVTNKKHLAELRKEIPRWCGLILIDGKGLTQIRQPQANKNIDPYSLVQLLWRDETVAILRQLGQTKDLSKPKKVLWQTLATSLSLDDLNSRVRETLKARKSWRVGQPQVVGDDLLLQISTS